MDVRLDFRLSHLLVLFRQYSSAATDKQQPIRRGLSRSLLKPRKKQAGALDSFLSQAWALFRQDITGTQMDAGLARMLVRVLLRFVMHENETVVCGAMELLYRNFDQRKELLDAFAQVQLLVSSSDSETHKIVSMQLNSLRSMVERSELWVYKRNNVYDENLKKISACLSKMTDLCSRGSPDHRAHHQRLLRNLDAHTEVMGLIQMPHEASPEFQEITKQVHIFLQHFCAKNKENQVWHH